MTRVGILGGAFNPVHEGHLLLAEGARNHLKLDRVLWIPAHLPPHKETKGMATAEERARMVELAIEGRPYFELSRVELGRPPPSYSIDTVRRLQAERLRQEEAAEWYFLVGSDAARRLPTWREIEDLRRRVRFAAVPRPGEPPADRLPYGVPELPVKTVNVSSTEIRRRIRAGESVEGLVPAGVLRYIEEKRLYR